MPAFGCDADDEAIATLTRLFPGRQVIGNPSGDLVWGLGAIHCLTQQHPRPYPDEFQRSAPARSNPSQG